MGVRPASSRPRELGSSTGTARLCVGVARLSVIAIAALASGPIFVACRASPAAPGLSTPAGAALAREPIAVAKADSTPPAAVASPPASDRPIALPRVKDYEPIPALRDIYFDVGTAEIRPSAAKTLDTNAAWLRANPGYLVLIEGHADNRGATNKKNELNMDLGERRAQAAMKYLVAHGIDANRITILSYGEERPQCAEASERCWRLNRRSRFLVKPR
jgi:peptidoglycan-associated lipoprotein